MCNRRRHCGRHGSGSTADVLCKSRAELSCDSFQLWFVLGGGCKSKKLSYSDIGGRSHGPKRLPEWKRDIDTVFPVGTAPSCTFATVSRPTLTDIRLTKI